MAGSDSEQANDGHGYRLHEKQRFPEPSLPPNGCYGANGGTHRWPTTIRTIPIAPIPPTRKFAARPDLDSELQADPELAEGPASGGRVAMFAIAIAVVLGAVFYGLNNIDRQPGRHDADHLDGAEHDRTSPPTAPTGMRDVTPRANTEPGHDDRRRAGTSGSAARRRRRGQPVRQARWPSK